MLEKVVEATLKLDLLDNAFHLLSDAFNLAQTNLMNFLGRDVQGGKTLHPMGVECLALGNGRHSNGSPCLGDVGLGHERGKGSIRRHHRRLDGFLCGLAKLLLLRLGQAG